MTQHAQIESQYAELLDSQYYKKVQKELREKAVKKIDEEKRQLSNLTMAAEQHPIEDVYYSSDEKKSSLKKELDSDKHRDQVRLNAQAIYEELAETTDKNSKNKQDLQEKSNQLVTNMKYNAKEIMRHLAYKIDFVSRKDELKEMFKFNWQQSRSDNVFISRFSQFKVGIVGQILTGIGIPIEELKKLKKQAFQDIFDENCVEMQENIYNTELMELLHGKKRKVKRSLKMFAQLQQALITKMNNIGRVGYWSKTRLIEEKIKQTKRIRDEFAKEKETLAYLLEFYQQERLHDAR